MKPQKSPAQPRRAAFCVALTALTLIASLLPAPAAATVTDADMVRVARQHSARGRFVLAASILRTAFEVSGNAQYLYLSAQAEQRAVRLDAAERNYRLLIARPDADPRLVADAHVQLAVIARLRAELRATRVRARAAAAANARRFERWQRARERTDSQRLSAQTAPAVTPEWQRPVAITAMSGGAVLLWYSAASGDNGAATDAMLVAGSAIAGAGTALLLSPR